MNAHTWQFDLVVLAADKDMEMAVRGLLTRQKSLGIRNITADCLVHPEHDPGCARTSEVFLRPYIPSHQHALVVMDHEGSGCKSVDRAALELRIENLLRKNGWDDRAAVVVITPELENWVWSDSPLVDEKLGWQRQPQPLRACLEKESFWMVGEPKPSRPKEALIWALRRVRQPRSSAIYRQLAEAVDLLRCSDPAFQKLRRTLQNWFPAD